MLRYVQLIFAFLLLVVVSATSAVAQSDIIVSRTDGPYFSLRNAVADAGPGGTIRIKEGRYAATDLQIPYDLTIIGEGEVILASARPVAKGLLVPLRGVSLEVRGLIFENATAPDKNGAGIRVEGNELIVRDSVFRNNENGVLATGSDGSEITIIGSRFVGNGYGDGYSHGIYVAAATRFEVSGSRFEGTRIGHHVKSIASIQTVIRNSTFDDTNGQPSYIIDVTGGGNLLVEGNVMKRRASAEQQTLINYDTSRGGRTGEIKIQNNQVTNAKPAAKLLRNPDKAPVYLTANSFDNIEGGTLDLPVSTPALYRSQSPTRFPVVEEKSIAEQADLSSLSPTQQRSVERLLSQGETLQVIEPAEQLAREQSALNEQTRIREQALAEAPYGVPEAPVAIPARRQSQAVAGSELPVAQRTAPATSEPVSDIITMPDFLPSQMPSDLAAINLVATGEQRATSGIITFGHSFRPGALMPSDPLTLKVNGLAWVLQKDVKALHRDGSVRHAILTLFVPPTQRDTIITGVLSKGQPVPDEPAFDPDLPGYGLTVSVSGVLADGTEFSGNVNLAELVSKAIADEVYWMRGELATEVTVRQEVGPLLTVQADIRFLADRSIRTRLIFENHKAFADGNRDMTYDVAVRDGRQMVMRRNGISHHRGNNWSEVIWKGRQPAYAVQLDPQYLVETGTMPPFDLTFGIKASALQANARKLNNDSGVFASGLMERDLPKTGGRADIGLLPEWDVHWLKTQDQTARRVMIAMAERAGAVPWHFDEDATGEPVRVDQRLNFWSEERGTAYTREPDNIPDSYFDGNDGGWKLDSAHKPLMSYTAYLATGDAYYARELASEAAFAISNIWPDLRQEGTIVAEAIQLRSRAWAIRDIGAAAWLLPDNDPLKTYFAKSLEDNLSYLFTSYVLGERMKGAGETEGWFAESVNGEPGRISPWQNDFMVMVLAQEAYRGSPIAGEIISWTANYHINRFLAGNADPVLGAAYVHVAKNPETEEPVGTWAEMSSRTRTYEGAAENYPRDGGGYVATAYAALASIYSVTASTQALIAIEALASVQTDELLFDPANENGVYSTSNFLLSLRDPDGTYRSLTELID